MEKRGVVAHEARVPELLRSRGMEYGRYGPQEGDEALRGSVRADGVSRMARLVELTLRGAAIETNMALRARDEVRLMFAVPGQAPIVIERAIVRYVDTDRISVEFVHMSVDDAARYRALVLDQFKRSD